ncbi:MAG: energy transducer TonB, partial [Burkholderiales bacterium]|nr:energy transducer TonB [Burkholderiales bacterium]
APRPEARPEVRPDLRAEPRPQVQVNPALTARPEARVDVAPPPVAAPSVRPDVRETPAPQRDVRPDVAPTRPAPVLESAPAVTAAPAVPLPSTAAPTLTPQPATPQVSGPAPNRPGPPRPAVDGAPTAPPIDRGALEQYGLLLSKEIGRDQRYPRRAQMLGWQGTTDVSVLFGADGLVKDVKILKSSGYEVLDEEAVAKVKRAKNLPAPPDATRGREFRVTVPILFKLE